ncbi:hypothetical protein DV704_11680 [Meiothermus sp. QL-1]|nr:hypothetical protein DV704_11680 [Meiothermus sp. QL-1]
MLTAVVLGLLAGCSSAPQPKLQAAIGTYSGAGGVGRSYILVLRPQQQPNSLTVNISGPGGYSESLTLQSAESRTPSGTWWQLGWGENRPLVSGTYTISTTIDGETLQVALDIDASRVLSPPAVTLGPDPTTKTVAVSWGGVSGASSYLVRLVNRSTQTVVARSRVTGLGFTFDNLGLNPADTYQVEVYAASSNISTDPPLVPAQFNLALGQSQPFTVRQAP